MAQLKEQSDQLSVSNSSFDGKKGVQLIKFMRASDSIGSPSAATENLPNFQVTLDDYQTVKECHHNQCQQQQEQPSYLGQRKCQNQETESGISPSSRAAPVDYPTEHQSSSNVEQKMFQTQASGVLHGFGLKRAYSDPNICSTHCASHQNPLIQQTPFVSNSKSNWQLEIGDQKLNTPLQWKAPLQWSMEDTGLSELFRKLADVIKDFMEQHPKKNAIEVITVATSKCRMKVACRFEIDRHNPGEALTVCSLEIGGVHVAQAIDVNRKKAKHAAYSLGLNMLATSCICIRQQGCFVMESVENQGLDATSEDQKRAVCASLKLQSSVTGTPCKKTQHMKSANNSNSLEDMTKFVLLNHKTSAGKISKAVAILCHSAKYNGVSIEFKFEVTEYHTMCHIYLGGLLISTATGPDKKKSKKNAAFLAVRELRKVCCMIELEQVGKSAQDYKSLSVKRDGRSAEESELLSKEDILQAATEEETGMSERLSESNMGHMLLKKMGWTGGGIGKHGTGIVEPIEVQRMSRRAGFGLPVNQPLKECQTGRFMKGIKTIIKNYVESDIPCDLGFFDKFTKNERNMIRAEARQYNVKIFTQSEGANKIVVISRQLPGNQVMEHVKDNGESTNTYHPTPLATDQVGIPLLGV